MGQRVKNKHSLQLDVSEETINELKDIQAIFQKNDSYGYVSMSKVIMILVKEKWKYYNNNNYFEPIQEEKVRPIKSHKQTKLKLDDKAKNNDFFNNNEVKDITIASMNESFEDELEEWKKIQEEYKKKMQEDKSGRV